MSIFGGVHIKLDPICSRSVGPFGPPKQEKGVQPVLGTEAILGSVGYCITDRRMFSVIGYLTQITETETENFPVGYSVGYFT